MTAVIDFIHHGSQHTPATCRPCDTNNYMNHNKDSNIKYSLHKKISLYASCKASETSDVVDWLTTQLYPDG